MLVLAFCGESPNKGDDMANRGFSLVELMMVAVMVGLLASIASPNFVALQERAKEAGVKCNMHTVQLACEEYAARSVGFYPDDVGDFSFSECVENPFHPDFVGAFAITDYYRPQDVLQEGDTSLSNEGQVLFGGDETLYVIRGAGKGGVVFYITLSPGPISTDGGGYRRP